LYYFIGAIYPYVFVSIAWDCQEVVNIKNLMQIDAGLGQVVATDTSQIPYYLVGDEWIRLPGSLKHITVGPAGIWGVNKADLIYKYVLPFACLSICLCCLQAF
uniref:Uncharacterized protein n=1 Tax=Oncorhynchus mykiss TaxID=8022 RepID=A0A8C7PJJ7_ONCMY